MSVLDKLQERKAKLEEELVNVEAQVRGRRGATRATLGRGAVGASGARRGGRMGARRQHPLPSPIPERPPPQPPC